MPSAATTYRGAPCKKCGATLKYRANWSCVACNHERSRLRLQRLREDFIYRTEDVLKVRRIRALQRLERRKSNGEVSKQVT